MSVTTGGSSAPPCDSSPGLATTVVRALDGAGVLVDDIEVRQPSLDDVFFSLTGGHIEEDEDVTGGEGHGRRRGPLNPTWRESTHDDHDPDADTGRRDRAEQSPRGSSWDG